MVLCCCPRLASLERFTKTRCSACFGEPVPDSSCTVLQITHTWIKGQMEAEGGDVSKYATSKVVPAGAPKALGELRAADDKE